MVAERELSGVGAVAVVAAVSGVVTGAGRRLAGSGWAQHCSGCQDLKGVLKDDK